MAKTDEGGLRPRSPEERKMRRALRVLDAWKLATGHPGMAPDLCVELCKAMETAEEEAGYDALTEAGRWLNANGFGPLAISMLLALERGNAAAQPTPSSPSKEEQK